MPVIQLPRDTRWSELGQGISTGLNALVEGYVTKQANEGVAKIMSDPSIAETNKQAEAYKQFGERGSEIFKQFVATQVLSATIAQKKADAAKDLATAQALSGKDDLAKALMGLPTSAPTASAPGTTVAPAAPVPASTVSSVLPGVLAGGAPAAPSPAPTPTSSAIVGTLSGPQPSAPPQTPVGAISDGSPVARMIDQRAAAGGVTFTPEEKQSLILQTMAHLRTTNGLSEIMAPTDKAIEQKQKGTKFPIEVATAQSGQQTAAAGATTAEAKAKVDLQRAQQESAELAAKAPYTGPRTAAETQIAQQTAAASEPTKIDTETVKQSFPTFSPEQAQAVVAAGQTGGPKAATAEISKVVDANAKGAVPEATAKFARETASYGSITERFAREMAAAPEKLGLLSGSGLRARAESYGLPIGDPQLLSLLNSQKLAAATAAKDTGNWGVSATNVALSKQISANIDRTAMSNVMMFAGAAAQKIKEAEIERAVYAGNPRAQAVIDQAIQPWKNIQAITDTLTSYVDTSKAIPGVNERDVTYFMGNQVDPQSMRALVRQDNTTYKVKPQGTDKQTSYTGEDIFAMARAAGIDPAAMLTRLGGRP